VPAAGAAGPQPGLTRPRPQPGRAPSGGVASCMAGESSFWQPAGTAQKPREGLVLVQHFNASTGAYLGSSNSTWDFSVDLRNVGPGSSPDHAQKFAMDMDGSVVKLPSGGLLASMYGPFVGDRANCSSGGWTGACSSIVISRSQDGVNWKQVGVASDSPTKVSVGLPCCSAEERSVIQLADGKTLLAVYKAGGVVTEGITCDPTDGTLAKCATCLVGFKLSDDQLSCAKCSAGKYGMECGSGTQCL
jgi:hypothetical protein